MSYPFPPFVDESVDSGSIKSSLLTPPLTPLHTNDVPFKPSESDRTSLNLKKKHHTHRKHKEGAGRPAYGNYRSDADMRRGRAAIYPSQITRSKSFEVSRGDSLGSASPTAAGAATSSQAESSQGRLPSGEGIECSRRWTLSSKSEATRGFTPLRSTVRQSTISEAKESPAIITLRRATTNRAPKRTELTFFPEPTFSHERTGLLSYLVSTFSRTGTANDQAEQFFANTTRTSRSTSIDSDGVHPTLTFPAATVCTEITIDANLTMPGIPMDMSTIRRCSTKYVSADTTYEVIWDENDSLTTPPDSSKPSTSDRRRSSLAVMKLESQLARSDEISRRASKGSGSTSERPSRSSVGMFQEQVITPEKLERLFPKLIQKTGLRDLPRSRTGRKRKISVCSITVDDAPHQTLAGDGGRKESAFSIEFFPPLVSRRASRASLDPSEQEGRDNAEASMSLLKRWTQPRQGSLLGSSSHRRRKSSGKTDSASHRSSMAATAHVAVSQEPLLGETDTEPLLRKSVTRSDRVR